MSTDISEPCEISYLGGINSSQLSLDLNEAVIASESCDIGEHCQEQFQLERSGDQLLSDPAMAPPSAERSDAESSLRELDTQVRDMISDLSPTFITQGSAPHMERDLDKIAEVRDKFRKAVRVHLTQFDSELESTEKAAWESDLASILHAVQFHKHLVLEKVTQLLPQAAPMSEFEKETIALQKRNIKMKEDALDSKKDDALATAKPLKKLVMEKCTELEE